MAQWKYTIKRGINAGGVAAVAAGSAEAQSDTISLNMDITAMSRGEAVQLIDKLKDAVLSNSWPPL